MAQQTINIGASPNDGTGTPLRTAFQYTNSNFSELYTAVGPSGNNIVCPGSATITGDLTVDTNTLKVDSANNRVGIGTASPGCNLEVYSSSANELRVSTITAGDVRLGMSVIGTTYNWIDSLRSGGAMVFGVGNAEHYRITSGGTFTWSDGGGGTRMTLNSTGLGVGTATHSVKLGVVDAGNTFAATFRGNGGTDFVAIGTTGFGASINAYTAGFGAATNLVLNPNGGNVGIGVTPSAWASGYKGLQIKDSYAGLFANTSSGISELVSNAYNDGAWKFANAGNGAARYQMDALNRTHAWFYAATSANPITWTQAMTLDASGNLLVGKTAASGFTVGFQALPSGEISSTMSASSSAASTLNVYSTGAAAYRFYVGMNGTINATNTTISAISDARLKENVQDIDVGLGAILALKPRKFDWKAGKGKDIKGDRGFIAQEFEQVFPNLIDEWKDAAPEGEAPYKSVRQDLIPVLVKAIQELTARVQTLETR